MAYDFENSPFASLFGMSDYTPSDYAANAGNTFNFADTMSSNIWDDLLNSSEVGGYDLGGGFDTGSLSDLFSVSPDVGGDNSFLSDLGLSGELSGFKDNGLQDILNQNSNSIFGYGLDKPEDIDSILQGFGLSPDKILEMDINWQGKNDLYDVLKQQLDQGLITEEQANNFYQGLTSDGKPYDFRSPEQTKALAAQLQQALKSGAIDQGAAARIVQAIKTGAGANPSSGVIDKLKQNPVGALKALTQMAKFATLLGGLKESSNNSLSARGSTGTVNWGSGSSAPRTAPKFYADGGVVTPHRNQEWAGYRDLDGGLRKMLNDYNFRRKNWINSAPELQTSISGATLDTLPGIMTGAGYVLRQHGPQNVQTQSPVTATPAPAVTTPAPATTDTPVPQTFPASNANTQAFSNYAGRVAPRFYAKGGPVGSGLGSITVMLADKARAKGLIPGAEGGQDDNVDARLSPGEYVIDAESVSALGDGNTEAGAKKLDKMRHSIRKHKRQGGLSSIPPKAKEPEAYLKG